MRLAALGADERAALLGDLVGARANRRHRPGRGFEALRYRFEIVSDYGAFRDLQRHRMLTVQWQALTPDLGAGVPEEVDAAGAATTTAARWSVSRAEYERLVGAGHDARGALRAVPRLPHPLRARPQRARGDAAHRAALGPRGPSVLPRRRPRDAPPDRRGPPRGRRGDDPRRHRRRAAARSASSPRCARRLSSTLGLSRAERRRAGGVIGRSRGEQAKLRACARHDERSLDDARRAAEMGPLSARGA